MIVTARGIYIHNRKLQKSIMPWNNFLLFILTQIISDIFAYFTARGTQLDGNDKCKRVPYCRSALCLRGITVVGRGRKDLLMYLSLSPLLSGGLEHRDCACHELWYWNLWISGNPIARGYTNRATTIAKVQLYYYGFCGYCKSMKSGFGFFLLSNGLDVLSIFVVDIIETLLFSSSDISAKIFSSAQW